MKSAVGAALYRVCTLGSPPSVMMGDRLWAKPLLGALARCRHRRHGKGTGGQGIPPFLFLFLGTRGKPLLIAAYGAYGACFPGSLVHLSAKMLPEA